MMAWYIMSRDTISAEHACSQLVEILYDSSPAPRKANYLWYYTSASAEELVVFKDCLGISHKHITHTLASLSGVSVSYPSSYPRYANYLWYYTSATVEALGVLKDC